MFPTTLRSISWNYSFLSLHLFHLFLGKVQMLGNSYSRRCQSASHYSISPCHARLGPR
uniref:Uncharacterized protein n=1 Tax=Anguilla anguilla TaxID=7936 RepID=A0A0E9TRQ3_ANGAN